MRSQTGDEEIFKLFISYSLLGKNPVSGFGRKMDDHPSQYSLEREEQIKIEAAKWNPEAKTNDR